MLKNAVGLCDNAALRLGASSRPRQPQQPLRPAPKIRAGAPVTHQRWLTDRRTSGGINYANAKSCSIRFDIPDSARGRAFESRSDEHGARYCRAHDHAPHGRTGTQRYRIAARSFETGARRIITSVQNENTICCCKRYVVGAKSPIGTKKLGNCPLRRSEC